MAATGKPGKAAISAISPNRRARPTDYPIAEDNSPIKVANFNGVGGGTILYAGHFPRLHPSDFKVKSLDGIAEDWPIDYRTLEPFYAENDRMTGVSGLPATPPIPRTSPSMPPLPLGRSGEILARAMNKLGWHWWPSDSAVASMDYEGRARCINLGHCTAGCAQGAKASTDITYWPAAIRAGVELRTRARVREITVGPDGMANGAIYYDADGREVFQPAHVVILACNGVGTPRILLNSKSATTPQRPGQLLRPRRQEPDVPPLRQHLRLFRQEAGRQSRPPAPSGARSSTKPTRPRGFVRGFTFQFIRGRRRRLHRGQRHAGPAAALGPRTTTKSTALRTTTAPAWPAICEDLPEEHNTVTLDPVLKDSHGIPAPKIDYTMSKTATACWTIRRRPRHRNPDRSRRRDDRRQRNAPSSTGRLAPHGHRAHGHRPEDARWSTNGAARTT
jgi:choline dehydrogenase-like flavoprotein